MIYIRERIYRATILGIFLTLFNNGLESKAISLSSPEHEDGIQKKASIPSLDISEKKRPPLPLTPSQQEEAKEYFLKSQKLILNINIDLTNITQNFSSLDAPSSLTKPKTGFWSLFQWGYRKKYEDYGKKYENIQEDIKAFESWVETESSKLQKNLEPFQNRQTPLTQKDFAEIKTLVDGYKKDSIAFSNSIQNKIIWAKGDKTAKVLPPFQTYKQLEEYFQPLLGND